MPFVTINRIVCDDPRTNAYTVFGTASDANQVSAELRFVSGGLPATTPLMVTVTGVNDWTSTFNTDPANSSYTVFAKLNDGTQPPPTDQMAVPPCEAR